MAYLAYGVTVSVELNIESPATFPAVTVCNLNAYDMSDPDVIDTIKMMQLLNLIKKPNENISQNDYLLDLQDSIKSFVKTKYSEILRNSSSNILYYKPKPDSIPSNNFNSSAEKSSLNLLIGFNSSLMNSSFFMNKTEQVKVDVIPNELKYTNSTKNDNQTIKLNIDIGFKLRNVILSCKYNKSVCVPDDFNHFYSYEYGNCYTFNKKGLQNIRTVSTTKVGLELELYAGMSGKI